MLWERCHINSPHSAHSLVFTRLQARESVSKVEHIRTASSGGMIVLTPRGVTHILDPIVSRKIQRHDAGDFESLVPEPS